MSEAELIFTTLAELSTRQIVETTNAAGMEKNKSASKLVVALLKKQSENLNRRVAKKL